MAGSKNSGNPYNVTINFDREVGEAIISIINGKGYGKGTFGGKILLEVLKDDLIQFWSGQGKNGLEIWNKWYLKWNMKRDEQEAIKECKKQEEFEKRKKAYLALNCSEDVAVNLANAFPDKDACEIIKMLSFVKQTDLSIQKHEEKAKVEADKKQEEIIALEISQQKKQEKEEWEKLSSTDKMFYEMKLKTQPNMTKSEYLAFLKQEAKATPIEKFVIKKE